MSNTHSLRESALAAVDAAQDLKALDELRVRYMGKKGEVTALLHGLKDATPDERKTLGQEVNRLKQDLQAAINARRDSLQEKALSEALESERIDISLPGRGESAGGVHPLTLIRERMVDIFQRAGFSVAEGPEIEDDYHNFEALNFPPDHPARAMHDTFYVDGESHLLRTHTSPVQIHTMEAQKPPIRIIIPGKTYRQDSDATHSPMFHQVEGLVVDRNANVANLKWVLTEFCKAFFEVEHINMRFRPSFFPFTEPSMEVDIQCDRSKPGEVRFGEGTDWMEVLGCGMVHPNVLRMSGLDPDEYQGFAWGIGIDRLAMLKYGMPDLRAFFDADVRWLSHYGFRPLDMPTLFGGLSS
ncbi:MAG: phenylalanine--tRNA ligase subunit alpha [Oricola sp.]|nr:phenylalanine--tRNA ligase subunit alpha [Oricola sp.]